jgi:hypothetical protein
MWIGMAIGIVLAAILQLRGNAAPHPYRPGEPVGFEISVLVFLAGLPTSAIVALIAGLTRRLWDRTSFNLEYALLGALVLNWAVLGWFAGALLTRRKKSPPT